MTTILEPPFKSRLRSLPPNDQKAILDAVADPRHPRCRLKKILSGRLRKESWSIRIRNFKFRAVAQKEDGAFRWYWVGTREEANRLFC